MQENSTIVAATCFHAPDAMKEPPCRHPHGGSFINTIRKTLRPPQTLPADGKTGKQVILPISRPPACHAGSESRAGKESPVYKPAIPVHFPPENGDARHTPDRLKPEADIDNLSERCGRIYPARHQDKLRSTDIDILAAAVFLHFLHPPACSQIIGKGGR